MCTDQLLVDVNNFRRVDPVTITVPEVPRTIFLKPPCFWTWGERKISIPPTQVGKFWPILGSGPRDGPDLPGGQSREFCVRARKFPAGLNPDGLEKARWSFVSSATER